ncbi:MAG TPA: type II toxin-antitoxin system HipA family toxin [Gemmatimonadales bacterium]|nr:type II toxin-antitoxin system HipA family toxin [Gemmatimonadales bacterium]
MAEFTVFAEVRLWGHRVGAVAEDDAGGVTFEYAPEFRRLGLEISPRHLPLARAGPLSFPALRRVDAFQGLPGVLADALPDRFGNAVIAQYFARAGRAQDALSPVQRLLYIGRRAMGALEFEPAIDRPRTPAESEALEVKGLVDEARRIVAGDVDVALPEMMQLGASAGGAHPKAVILWDPARKSVRSGFAEPAAGEEAWIIKFDGVGELHHPDPAPEPYNRIEAAYVAMARAAGLETADVRLLEERRLAHLLSRRFDRAGSERLHLHSLGGLDHADFNAPGTYSYEQYLRVVLELGLPPAALEEAYRRAVFNVVAVNQDDHVKNFAFLMDRAGTWRLAPAYDLTFARGSGFTRHHQLALNGKVDDFRRADLLALGARFGVRRDGAAVIDQVVDAVGDWPRYAAATGVPKARVTAIGAAHRRMGA